MKRLMLIGFMVAGAQFGMAQTMKVNDPLVSASNYKHPDKAAFAKKHNLDRRTELAPVTVADRTDYKHPKKKVKMKRSAGVPSYNGINPAASHKHPLG